MSFYACLVCIEVGFNVSNAPGQETTKLHRVSIETRKLTVSLTKLEKPVVQYQRATRLVCSLRLHHI